MALAEKFERNTRMIGKTVRQDEKDFPLDVLVNLKNDRVYGKRTKPDVADKNLFASTNKMSRKVMLFAEISCYGATKPFFVNENGIKVNKQNYCKRLKNSFFLQLKSASSHRSNLVQHFLQKALKDCFVKNAE